MKVNLYQLIKNEKNIYVKVNPSFKNKLFEGIKTNFKTLSNYQKTKMKEIKYATISHLFNYGKYDSLQLLLKIVKDLNLDEEDIFNEIIAFRLSGSRVETYLPRYLEIDKELVKAFSLYLAEGDTGLNGKTIPSKVRFTNSELPIILYFKKVLLNYFKQKEENLKYYIYLPKNNNLTKTDFIKDLNTPQENLHLYVDKSVTVPKYRLSLERKIILMIILKLNDLIKDLCLKDKELASAYLEGISAGEGTAYCKKMKYIRIEMKNEKEMKYISSLFKLIDINHKLYERNTRKGMWCLYISKKENIFNFNELVSFNLCKPRQEILDNIVNYYSSPSQLLKL
ncbi:MAG: LAGLIDADG family homing endonuclease [Candidatus Nanoarchaeia archaeon]